MANTNSKKSSRGRTIEAKLLITAASIAATLSGLAMFADQNADTMARNQAEVVVTAPASTDAGNYPSLPYVTPEIQEQAPSVEASPTPGTTTSARSQRSQSGRPTSLGITRSSR